jgi:hypothetical protein
MERKIKPFDSKTGTNYEKGFAGLSTEKRAVTSEKKSQIFHHFSVRPFFTREKCLSIDHAQIPSQPRGGWITRFVGQPFDSARKMITGFACISHGRLRR